jgi:class 3 adenylate cyclase
MVLAVFDDPVDASAATRRAITAALEVQRQGRSLRERWRKRGQDLGLKMALNAGFATLGPVRAGSYSKHAAVGSSVNAVFHLTGMTRDDVILATSAVADAASGLALVIPRPEIKLPALARRIEVFELRPLSESDPTL